MMTSTAYPFLRLDENAVTASSWLVSVEGRPYQILSSELQSWDYSATLNFTKTVEINFDTASEQLQIRKGDLRLLVVVSIGTGGGRLPRKRSVVWRRVFDMSNSKANIQTAVDSSGLAHNVTLLTDVVLADVRGRISSLAPSRTGTRLWSNETIANIESSEPRFSIEVVSFRRLLREQANDALWFLDWPAGEFAHEFALSVRLFLNADFPEFVDRVHTADKLTLEMMTSSVMVQMAGTALNAEDFCLEMAEEQGATVGAVIARWLRNAFPNQSLSTIKSRKSLDPGVFEAALCSLASDR